MRFLTCRCCRLLPEVLPSTLPTRRKQKTGCWEHFNLIIIARNLSSSRSCPFPFLFWGGCDLDISSWDLIWTLLPGIWWREGFESWDLVRGFEKGLSIWGIKSRDLSIWRPTLEICKKIWRSISRICQSGDLVQRYVAIWRSYPEICQSWDLHGDMWPKKQISGQIPG